MKINQINYSTMKNNNLNFGAVPYPEYEGSFKSSIKSFGHTAVPYPEYEDSYYTANKPQPLSKVIDKISSIFTPEVTKKSQDIKTGINKIYDIKNQNIDFNGTPKEHLLSVLA